MGVQLPRLGYPIQQQYTIPYLSHSTYAVSLILVILLALLNVTLVGSDVVTVITVDPTSIEDTWWRPRFWPKSLHLNLPQKCEPVSITSDMGLSTNSSLNFFTYSMRRATRGSHNESQRLDPAPYIANKLSNCAVNTVRWRLDPIPMMMEYKSVVRCTVGATKGFEKIETPNVVTLSVTHKRTFNSDLTPDDVIEYMTYNTGPDLGETELIHLPQIIPMTMALKPDETSPMNVVSILNGLHLDLFHAIWAQVMISGVNGTAFNQSYFIEWAATPPGYPNCFFEGLVFNQTCGDVTDESRYLRIYGADNGFASSVAPFLDPFYTSILNGIVAVRDAILVDLGSPDTDSNIYLNKTYFNQVIQVDPFHDEAWAILSNKSDIPSEVYWNFCGLWNCVTKPWVVGYRNVTGNETTPVAVVTPYNPPNIHAQNVFNFQYLCPTFQRKAIGPLLISVFVATATTFSVLFSLFSICMPIIDERYQKRRLAASNGVRDTHGRRGGVYPLQLRSTVFDSFLSLDQDTKSRPDVSTDYLRGMGRTR